MPSLQEAAPSPPPFPTTDVPAGACASPAQQLAQASRALWLATLALMTAYMHHQGPAHRLLLARRIARNLDTLAAQDCFSAGCRATFVSLAHRWQARARLDAPGEARPRSGLVRLLRLFS